MEKKTELSTEEQEAFRMLHSRVIPSSSKSEDSPTEGKDSNEIDEERTNTDYESMDVVGGVVDSLGRLRPGVGSRELTGGYKVWRAGEDVDEGIDKDIEGTDLDRDYSLKDGADLELCQLPYDTEIFIIQKLASKLKNQSYAKINATDKYHKDSEVMLWMENMHDSNLENMLVFNGKATVMSDNRTNNIEYDGQFMLLTSYDEPAEEQNEGFNIEDACDEEACDLTLYHRKDRTHPWKRIAYNILETF